MPLPLWAPPFKIPFFTLPNPFLFPQIPFLTPPFTRRTHKILFFTPFFHRILFSFLCSLFLPFFLFFCGIFCGGISGRFWGIRECPGAFDNLEFIVTGKCYHWASPPFSHTHQKPTKKTKKIQKIGILGGRTPPKLHFFPDFQWFCPVFAA